MRNLQIQIFASTWDDLKDLYGESINSANNQLANLESEKQTELDNYNENYNNQLNQYKELQQQQQDYIDKYAEQQKETQQKQTDYNINLINQNKEQAEKDTEKEIKNSYIDYMKQNNQYGGALENLATNGLATSGLAESSKIAIYNTYQNRVGIAKESLSKANQNFDNQIQQALLSNDASLAEIALNQMQQSYQLALSGFEYTSQLNQNKLSFETSLNDRYYTRQSDLQSRIDSLYGSLASINQQQESFALQREQLAEEKAQREREYQQWKQEFAENQRQFNKTYNATYNNDYSYSDSTGVENESNSDVYDNWTPYGNSRSLTQKKDYYFKNGYQPQYVNNGKLKKTGVTVGEAFGSQLPGVGTGQNVWYSNGRYYVWVDSEKNYIDVTSEASRIKNQRSFLDGIFHKID